MKRLGTMRGVEKAIKGTEGELVWAILNEEPPAIIAEIKRELAGLGRLRAWMRERAVGVSNGRITA